MFPLTDPWDFPVNRSPADSCNASTFTVSLNPIHDIVSFLVISFRFNDVFDGINTVYLFNFAIFILGNCASYKG